MFQGCNIFSDPLWLALIRPSNEPILTKKIPVNEEHAKTRREEKGKSDLKNEERNHSVRRIILTVSKEPH